MSLSPLPENAVGYVPLPDYVIPCVELLYMFRTIERPYRVKRVMYVRGEDALRITTAFPHQRDLALYLTNIREAQRLKRFTSFHLKAEDVAEFGGTLTAVADVTRLASERFLVAKRSTAKGMPFLIAARSVENLLALVDAGPLPRMET